MPACREKSSLLSRISNALNFTFAALACIYLYLQAPSLLAQQTRDYEIVGGVENPVCKQYFEHLRTAVSTSSNGKLGHHPSFDEFDDPVSIPSSISEVVYGIAGLKVDINNDGEVEQMYRTLNFGMHGRGDTASYWETEYMTVYFSGYARAEASAEFPASSLPLRLYDWPDGWQAKMSQWEDVVSPSMIISDYPDKTVKSFEEEFVRLMYGQESHTYIYSNSGKNYFSTNVYGASVLNEEKREDYYVVASALGEYMPDRKISVLCALKNPE